MSIIITEKDLMLATGFKRRSALENYLRSHKIKFLLGKNGIIWTTLDAVNVSLGLSDSKSADIVFV